MGTEIGPYAVVMNQQEPCGVDAREHLPRRGRLCRVPWMPARLVSGSNAISVVGRDGAVDDWKQQLAAFNRRRLVPARPGEGWRGDLDDDRKWLLVTGEVLERECRAEPSGAKGGKDLRIMRAPQFPEIQRAGAAGRGGNCAGSRLVAPAPRALGSTPRA